MKLQDSLEKDSFRKRADASMRRRKKQLRSRIILLNSAIALIIIMVVLVTKVVSLNVNNKGKETDKKINVKKEAQINKKKIKKTPAPTPTATPMPKGKDAWIRKDLDPSKPMVALTFDDGPYAPVTKKILATLKKYDAKATFFCVGDRVKYYESTVKQAYAQGCQLASHTYNHVRLTGMKKKKIKHQIAQTDKVFEKIIGCKTTALRPPEGRVDKKVSEAVGVPMYCWDVDTEDWLSRNTKKIISRCKNVSDKDIVLMHDLYPTTAKAVEKIVPKLKKKGIQLVTIDELFYYKQINPKAGEIYYIAKKK